jgi:PadR family transcriptional regulator PadR
MKRRADDQGSGGGELLKGNTPTLILAVLEEMPRHGYAIAREIERRSKDALSLGEGSLYPALRALETDGLVVSAWETQGGGGPARKVYSLTDAGRKELIKRTHSWRQFSRAIDDVLKGKGSAEPA